MISEIELLRQLLLHAAAFVVKASNRNYVKTLQREREREREGTRFICQHCNYNQRQCWNGTQQAHPKTDRPPWLFLIDKECAKNGSLL